MPSARLAQPARKHSPPTGVTAPNARVVHLVARAGLERGQLVGGEERAEGMRPERAGGHGDERRPRAGRGEESVHQSSRRPVTSMRR